MDKETALNGLDVMGFPQQFSTAQQENNEYFEEPEYWYRVRISFLNLGGKRTDSTLAKATPANPKKQLIILPPNADMFTSPKSGKTYFVERAIEETSIKRYEMLEKMLIELQYSMTHQELQEHLVSQAKYLKAGDVMMSHVINYNIQTGLADMNSKYSIAFWICTIFIYVEGEDVTNWNVNTAREKIEDWQKNYAAGFFLHLRDTMFSELMRLCEHISQAFSELPLNQNFTTQRIKRLRAKYPLNPEPET